VPFEVSDKGKNNRIEVGSSTREKSSGRLIVQGDNNIVVIEEGCTFREALLRIGSNCSVRIGKSGNLNRLELYCLESARISIGQNASCTWYTRIYAHEPAVITIGKDCLIASEVLITASDMHTIYDMNTGERINGAQDITISDHVWLAAGVNVMKGVSIGENTVIGVGAIVTNSIPNNCVAAGVPARVLRTGTNWRPDLI
jgi:acetyltransferase-like isoleucine patch superfamily enzyme